MEYKVIRSNRKTIGMEIKEGELIVRVPVWITNQQVNEFVRQHEQWILKHLQIYREHQEQLANVSLLTMEDIHKLADEALLYIPERVKYYASIIGVTYGRITVRNQKSRWGSCSSKGNLNFNCLLMLTPKKVIDSVVVHELCHRKEMNHSNRFYAEVLRVFPEYKECDKWLKENGKLIMMRVTS